MDARQRAVILGNLARRPGSTAWQASAGVPVPEVRPGEYRPAHVPMTLMLSILRGLAADGVVRSEPDPRGQRWYLTGPPEGMPDEQA